MFISNDSQNIFNAQLFKKYVHFKLKDVSEFHFIWLSFNTHKDYETKVCFFFFLRDKT